MDNHTPQINGALLRMRREELGWALTDLATRACLSHKQVKQIEEGGTSSFYSETVKATAAKKIGGILGLPEQSVFVVNETEITAEESVGQDVTHHDPLDTAPSEHSETVSQLPLETSVIQKSTNSALDSEEKPKSKNSFWFIIALFVAALGLAAVMQKPAPVPPVEPAPPLQVLPPEQPDPAASAPVAAASAVVTGAPVVAPATPVVAPAPVPFASKPQ